MDETALLGRPHARRGAAVPRVAALPHLDEDERAVAVAQDQVDLAAVPARAGGDPIIARQQRQAVALQMGQGPFLGVVAERLVVARPPVASLHVHRSPPAAAAAALRRRLPHRRALNPVDPAPLLAVARSAAGAQQYPAPALYVVATPIGNLADLSLRAVHVLALADAIACEDTRHTAPLLRHLGLDSKPLIARTATTSARPPRRCWRGSARGERVACVSDAGTPAVSDPGALLVAAVRDAGYRVVPVPGASSALAALCVSGDAGAGQSARSASSASCRRAPASARPRWRAWPRGARRRCCSRRRTASRRSPARSARPAASAR